MTRSASDRRIKLTRRACLGVLGAPLFISDIGFGASGRKLPSERITIGVVGAGSRGFNLIDEFLNQADAQIVAVCDVDSFHHRDRRGGRGRLMDATLQSVGSTNITNRRAAAESQ